MKGITLGEAMGRVSRPVNAIWDATGARLRTFVDGSIETGLYHDLRRPVRAVTEAQLRAAVDKAVYDLIFCTFED